MKTVPALALCLALAAAAPVQDTTDKRTLRYSFKKGETVALDATMKVTVRLDEVPEMLEGVIAEDVMDLKVSGRIEAEVAEVSDDGTAVLKGKWRKMKAKGHAMVSEVELDYDADKPGKDAPPAQEDFGGFPGMDIQGSLETMARTPVTLTVDPRGRAKQKGAAAGFGGQVLALTGLMGPLPEKKVGRGDSWKSETPFEVPSVGVPLKFTIVGENTYVSDEGEAAVIVSKYKVDKVESDAAAEVDAKIKVKGEGEAKTVFSPKAGRPLSLSEALKVRVEAAFEDPTSGEELSIKASMKMERGYKVAGKDF